MSNQVFSPSPYQAASVSSLEGGAGGPASAPPQGPPPNPAVAPPPEYQPLKRPVLTAKEYESMLMDNDAPSDILYDYSVVDAW